MALNVPICALVTRVEGLGKFVTVLAAEAASTAPSGCSPCMAVTTIVGSTVGAALEVGLAGGAVTAGGEAASGAVALGLEWRLAEAFGRLVLVLGVCSSAWIPTEMAIVAESKRAA